MWFSVALVLLVLVLVAGVLAAVYISQPTVHQDNQRVADEVALAAYAQAPASTREALASMAAHWTGRAYLHRQLLEAALGRTHAAIAATTERLDAQAEQLGTLFTTADPDYPADQLVRGLKAYDAALVEAAVNYQVGDTPSYDQAVGTLGSTHLLVGQDSAALEALADYQAASLALLRAVARSSHSTAFLELDKAVAASQALGNALLRPLVQ